MSEISQWITGVRPWKFRGIGQADDVDLYPLSLYMASRILSHCWVVVGMTGGMLAAGTGTEVMEKSSL